MAVCEGFETMYTDLPMDRVADYLYAQSVCDVRSRFLLRPTNTYAQILRGMRSPRNLADGIRTSLCLNTLLEMMAPRCSDPRARAIVAAEKTQLLRYDVPTFASCAGTRSLYGNGELVARDFFVNSGLDRVRSRLALSHREFRREAVIIEKCLRDQ